MVFQKRATPASGLASHVALPVDRWRSVSTELDESSDPDSSCDRRMGRARSVTAILLAMLGAAQAARQLKQGGNQPWYNQVRQSFQSVKAVLLSSHSCLVLSSRVA